MRSFLLVTLAILPLLVTSTSRAEETWLEWSTSKTMETWEALRETSDALWERTAPLLPEFSSFEQKLPQSVVERSYVLWQSTWAAWNQLDTNAWIPADLLPPDWSLSLNLEDGWQLLAWVPDEQIGPTVAKLQSMTLKASNRIPDLKWFRDFSVTTGVVATATMGPAYGCAIVATPGGPVAIALAAGACGIVGSQIGATLVREGYNWFEEPLETSAYYLGKDVGNVFGSVVGMAGTSVYATWKHFHRYKEFGGYAKEARALTASTLRKTPSNASQLRADGFDIDHVIPVKCGWLLGISVEKVASWSNLHALPSSINRAIGSKGC